MRNQLLQAEIENEVRRRVQGRARFTALDISRAVQAMGFRERHAHMKHVVHALYISRAMGPDYRRTPITLSGGQTPFLYHHYADAPSAASAASANNFRTASARNKGNVRALDRWNRLRLPARALRDAGVSPGDVVHVVVDTAGGSVALHVAPPAAPGNSRRYTVDRYNNVRVALGIGAGAPVARSFTVAVSSAGVVTATCA